MIELVYMSQAQHIFGEEELQSLLDVSRRNNTRRGITGMLLYDGKGTFIQAIEGDEEKIYELFNIIKQDPRHADIQELGVTAINERNFGDWKMGFNRITPEDFASIDGFTDFMESQERNELPSSNNSFAVAMLNHFKQSI